MVERTKDNFINNDQLSKYHYEAKRSARIAKQFDILIKAYSQGYREILCAEAPGGPEIFPLYFKASKDAADALIDAVGLHFIDNQKDLGRE